MKTHWISEANITRRERKHLAGRNTWHTYAKTQANRAVRRAAREEIEDGLAEQDMYQARDLDAGDVQTHYEGNPIMIATALCYLLDQPSDLLSVLPMFTRIELDQGDWGYYDIQEYYLSDDTLFASNHNGYLEVTERGWRALHQHMGITPLSMPRGHNNPAFVLSELGELL